MITNRTSIAARVANREAERRANLHESFADLMSAVRECERFEREHPYTVATIRALAPRTIRLEDNHS
jgi:hypothetical protein